MLQKWNKRSIILSEVAKPKQGRRYKMTQFKVGKVYTTRFIGDSNIVLNYRVIHRSASTVIIEDVKTEEVKKCRIIKKLSEYRDAESVYPMGQYSMAPILSA